MTKVKTTRLKRKARIRKRVFGTADRPRLSVFRSSSHIYAQLIDDSCSKTLATVSTISAQHRDKLRSAKGRKDVAKMVGVVIAELAKSKGIQKVVFDCSGYLYHGRVRSLAEGAREGGLEF